MVGAEPQAGPGPGRFEVVARSAPEGFFSFFVFLSKAVALMGAVSLHAMLASNVVLASWVDSRSFLIACCDCRLLESLQGLNLASDSYGRGLQF